jgi:glyoxylase-like metal-dependent hydrolase (beta-lactamase superfamily II)
MSHQDGRHADALHDPPVQPGVPVRLSARVWRLTCANAGLMTGPGTNSYFVGEGEHWALIDPGPAQSRHLFALQSAAPGPIRHILVTHTHPDHSPGAAALKRLSGAEVLGRLSTHAPGQDPSFVPDRELTDGDRVELGPNTVLRVLHTPGHASNHLCYLLEAEGLLFTGDHIIQGSTVVIDPPDGDMQAYIDSLQRLLREDLTALAPGHGQRIDEPQEALCALLAPRLNREAKVLEALSGQQPATLAQLCERAYEDVPPALWALAERSLLAHLLKLEAEGRARRHAQRWRAAL